MGGAQVWGQFEQDVRRFLGDEVAGFPERIRADLLKRAIEYRSSPERFSREELTTRTMVALLNEWAEAMMTDAEKADHQIARMSDRVLLESIYRKLWHGG